jgi:hypothetical protein
MKLQELAATKPTKQIAKAFESYFGSQMEFDRLSAKQARNMLARVRDTLKESRRQHAFHRSERNPAYLKLVMMEQALTARVKETVAPGAPGTTPGAPAAGTAPTTAQTTGVMMQNIKKFKDPATVTALTKASKGQSLTPDEQKLVAGAALMQAEGRLNRAYRMLKESEVQQAQVVLAAQDMVDKMQSMLEDASEMQFKELPALVDSIKNQVGIEQAQQFNTDATAALTGLMQNLQGAKQQLDAALGVVTGQTPPPDAGMAAMGGAPAPAADMADAGMDDLDAAADAAAGDMAAAPDEEEPASPNALGRGRR